MRWSSFTSFSAVLRKYHLMLTDFIIWIEWNEQRKFIIIFIKSNGISSLWRHLELTHYILYRFNLKIYAYLLSILLPIYTDMYLYLW